MLEQVVVTDYPDQDLVENLKYNVRNCQLDQNRGGTIGVEVGPLPTFRYSLISYQGYLWGAALSSALSPGFDLLILADLLFNHSEHTKLVKSISQTLRRTATAKALVFFTPYRPWLLKQDLAFFDLARQEGFVVEMKLEKLMDKVMFVEDRGDETLRRTVYGYELRWA